MKQGARAIAAVLVVAPVLAADPAYVGKWKVNPAKSVVTGDTVTIESTAGGMMQFSSQGVVYTFKTDGKEYPMPNGGTTAWTATSATVWDVTNRLNGKVTNTYHLVLNGNALAVSGKAMTPDGKSLDFTSSYKRLSGDPGFAGRWTSTEVKMPMLTLDITTSGENGVSITDDTGSISAGQFDGKDNAARGPLVSAKNSFTFEKLTQSSFRVTNKLAGKAMYVEVYTVSADGKTLTISGTPSNAKSETYKIVLDKQ